MAACATQTAIRRNRSMTNRLLDSILQWIASNNARAAALRQNSVVTAADRLVAALRMRVLHDAGWPIRYEDTSPARVSDSASATVARQQRKQIRLRGINHDDECVSAQSVCKGAEYPPTW